MAQAKGVTFRCARNEDELICTQVVVEQLIGGLCNLGAVRLRLLVNDHMEGARDTTCDSTSPRPSIPAQQRKPLLILQLSAELVRDDPSPKHKLSRHTSRTRVRGDTRGGPETDRRRHQATMVDVVQRGERRQQRHLAQRDNRTR